MGPARRRRNVRGQAGVLADPGRVGVWDPWLSGETHKEEAKAPYKSSRERKRQGQAEPLLCWEALAAS